MYKTFKMLYFTVFLVAALVVEFLIGLNKGNIWIVPGVMAALGLIILLKEAKERKEQKKKT